MSARALKVGDTVIQLTDAMAIRDAGGGSVWFISPSLAVRAKMSMADALKLLDWRVEKTAQPG